MVGCSHHSAPLEIRELFSFSEKECETALGLLRERYPASEFVLLSTCNRVELYSGAGGEQEGDETPRAGELIRFVAEFHSQGADRFRSHFIELDDRSALEHLFTVASSIDSIVVGESQIASQVNEAYTFAVQQGFAGPCMHAAFQHANQVAKRVANETEIHRRRISVPSVAVSEIASQFFERFEGKNIVVIGSGEMGVETLRYLKSAGANKVSVVNRSFERASAIAAELKVTACEWEDLDRLITEADMVVSTTGADEPIVNEARFHLLSLMRKRDTLLILDMAVPRDFEASIGNLPGVYLYSVDDLQAVCNRNKSFREQQLPRAKKIIQEEVERLLGDIHFRSSGATVKALRERADQIKHTELDRLLGKQAMQSSTPEMQEEISQAFDRLVNKMLHSPLQSLREESQGEQRDSLVSALRRLFQLR
jgi:glutamyl-tRNA reductase